MIRSCISSLGWGALVVALAIVGWIKRDELVHALERARGGPRIEAAADEVTGPELARQAENKIVALGQGEMVEAVFSAEELDSWIRYSLAGYFPEFVDDVGAEIDEQQRLVLSGDVAIIEIPGLERLGLVASLVGDTARVRVRGRVDGFSPGRGIYYVDDIQIGPLPLPAELRDYVIANLSEEASDIAPKGALSFELPLFVSDVAIRDGRLHVRGCGRASC
ncbi:MAG: hypothetical protein V3U38_01050 [Gemmatimonadota bacterium]